MDEHLQRAEIAVSIEGVKEILFGGEKEQGLVYLVREQAIQMKELSLLMNQLTKDVNGFDGMRADISYLKREFQRIEKYDERLQSVERSLDKRIGEVKRELEDEIRTKLEEMREKGPIPGWVVNMIAVALSVVAFAKEVHAI